jgi:hypothetical protein
MANAAMQRQRRLLALAALAGLSLAGLGLGAAGPAIAQPAPFSEEPTRYRSNKPYQSEVEREQRRRDEEAGARPDSPLTVTGGVDFRNQYFFRGYNYVSSGLIAQPYLVAGYSVYKDPDLAITPHGGAWFDLTEQSSHREPGEKQSITHVREFRGDLGVALEVHKFVFDFQYVFYNSPAEAFSDTHEIGVDVRYDDRAAWRDKPFLSGLNPTFSLFYEARDERDDDYNTFVGVGIEPALKSFEVGRLPVTVSFPVTVGGSYDGYYKDADGHNSNFGYWEAGVRAALPLGRSVFGLSWSLDAEVDYVNLMARSARAANGFDDSDIVFRIGLAFR